MTILSFKHSTIWKKPIVEDGNVFTRETLKVIETLTEKSWQIPYSTRVDSISNFQHTYAEGDDLIVEDLVSDAEQLSDADLARIKNVATNEPLLKQRLVSPQGHVTSVSANITLPNIDQTKEVPEVMTFARNLAEEPPRCRRPDGQDVSAGDETYFSL